MDRYTFPEKGTRLESIDRTKHPQICEDVLESSKLVYEEVDTSESNEMNPRRDSSSSYTALTLPSIVVDEPDENDDDPPPYTAIVPPNHVGWPFDFSSGIPYSAHTTTPCRAEVPLAPFQASLTSGSGFHPEGADGEHTSISVPLMPYRFFKFGSHRSLFVHRGLPFTDNTVTKDTTGKTRRYGGILVGAAVIVFLMALSLMVRFVVERSFWRG